MSAFRMAFHALTGRRMIEVWDADEFIAAIYPGDGPEFKIVSKFGFKVDADDDTPPGLKVTIGK